MKATVKECFIDKLNGSVHGVGEVIELSDSDRINDLVERGLIVVEKVAEKPKTTTKRKKDVK